MKGYKVYFILLISVSEKASRFCFCDVFIISYKFIESKNFILLKFLEVFFNLFTLFFIFFKEFSFRGFIKIFIL